MRRKKAFKRGRTIALVIAAAVIGYAVGGLHPTALDKDPSAAQSVAQRFPQAGNSTSPTFGAADLSTAARTMATTSAMNDAQLVLFNPEPMVRRASAVPIAQAPQGAASAAGIRAANGGDIAAPKPVSDTAAARVRTQPTVATRTPVLTVRQAAASRPGSMLDDAQIASIKDRLHLTPDQERMWPAVEAALRNIAYARVQAGPRRAAQTPGGEPAAVDPDTVASLKSAAVPLIMSFDDEQKQEVRNLAHVMGLDQLAAEF